MMRNLTATIQLTAESVFQPLADKTTVAHFFDRGVHAETDLAPCVSEEERRFAATVADPGVRRQFLLRRAFQRSFVARIIGWEETLATLPMRREPDQRPRCLAAPQLWLSFSSSGDIAIAAACQRRQVGIDIEKSRPVSDTLELSRRFLRPSEAAYLAHLPEARRADAFMRLWTIKEASLKAVGHGLGYGLDKFGIVPDGEHYLLDPPAEFGAASDWRITPLVMPDGYVSTLVIFRNL